MIFKSTHNNSNRKYEQIKTFIVAKIIMKFTDKKQTRTPWQTSNKTFQSLFLLAVMLLHQNLISEILQIKTDICKAH